MKDDIKQKVYDRHGTEGIKNPDLFAAASAAAASSTSSSFSSNSGDASSIQEQILKNLYLEFDFVQNDTVRSLSSFKPPPKIGAQRPRLRLIGEVTIIVITDIMDTTVVVLALVEEASMLLSMGEGRGRREGQGGRRLHYLNSTCRSR